jgi:Flp pilus assembly protein CpaB
LELTPDEAEKLSLASLEGQIVLALRSTQDDDIVQTQGSTTRDLLNIAVPPSPKRIEPPSSPVRYRVNVYIGSKKSELEF